MDRRLSKWQIFWFTIGILAISILSALPDIMDGEPRDNSQRGDSYEYRDPGY